MRIVAGTHRGRRLVAPAGGTTRPTADRVRESLFAILGPMEGIDVLDVFAGSGALGYEALSRGARSVTFVERDPAAVRALRANGAMFDAPDAIRVVVADWRAALRAEARARRRFALCLADPPYSLLPRIAGQFGAAVSPVLQPGATIVVEYATERAPIEFPDLDVVDRSDRVYGGTSIAVMRIGGQC